MWMREHRCRSVHVRGDGAAPWGVGPSGSAKATAGLPCSLYEVSASARRRLVVSAGAATSAPAGASSEVAGGASVGLPGSSGRDLLGWIASVADCPESTKPTDTCALPWRLRELRMRWSVLAVLLWNVHRSK